MGREAEGIEGLSDCFAVDVVKGFNEVGLEKLYFSPMEDFVKIVVSNVDKAFVN